MNTSDPYDPLPTAVPAQFSPLFLDWVFWLCIASAVIGAIIAVTGIVRSRWGRQSDEVTSNMLRLGIGLTALSSMGTLLSWMIIS
jgi:hypothetical protein